MRLLVVEDQKDLNEIIVRKKKIKAITKKETSPRGLFFCLMI